MSRASVERPAKPTLLPRLRVMVGGEIALGPGKVDLLEQIQATGSIQKAARALDMSYMRAWTLLKTMERCFKQPLVRKTRGGTKGGSAQLTDSGTRILELYRRMEQECLEASGQTWSEVRRHLRG